jgi:hypothetical protein
MSWNLSWNGISPLVAAVLISVACSQSPQRPDAESEEDIKKEWKEAEVKFPLSPRNETLVQFDVGGTSPHRFYIDPPSLAIGADGVVRYTLVTRTAGGATNITFEGIRCDGRRHKHYAVGEAGGAWAAARNPHWRRIEFQDADQQRLALVDNYLCQGNVPRGSREAMLDRLKRGPEKQF